MIYWQTAGTDPQEVKMCFKHCSLWRIKILYNVRHATEQAVSMKDESNPSSKKVIYIPHALERMKERWISEDLILETINHPDDIEYADSKRKVAQRFACGKLLRVIYEEDDLNIIVISAYWTSKLNKYMRRYNEDIL
ncbi:DUF4258 domain-containing protein [Methanothrix sp.]|uniref:DUF4258 domain-containing protein n=1 Tax=Methanothrix sp. TaxID=90426 RepID=UPI00257D55E6|nr:DUF4258 domain-containing protein [Methanothrix sp.]NPU87123.1 DUF4258 domain-containing protein [Methanothrix sp.]